MITLPLISNGYIQAGLLVLLGMLSISILLAILRYWRANFSRQRFRQPNQQSSQSPGLIDQINRLLPQTQCGQCGFEGCLPYARAIARGTAINQCPPGGSQTIQSLATLLNEYPAPLNPAHGRFEPRKLAVIREAECIGCTKCIQACPVDAILGGPKLMHTVIEIECTGCDLCVAPCPVDCIDLIDAPPAPFPSLEHRL